MANIGANPKLDLEESVQCCTAVCGVRPFYGNECCLLQYFSPHETRAVWGVGGGLVVFDGWKRCWVGSSRDCVSDAR